MKRIFCLLALTGLMITAVACRRPGYSNGLSATELSERMLLTLGAEREYLAAETDALADYFDLPDFVTDHTVYFCADRNNLDEFGIFHTENGRANEMASLLSDYLDRSLTENRAWYDSYIPAETPKLRDAEVRTFGNYAVYAVLSREDRATFFDAIEKELQKAA